MHSNKCFRHNGQDPSQCPQCSGDAAWCAEKKTNEYGPRLPETSYAFLLHSYIEAFRPDPADISWRDLEIYNAFLTAKNQYERKKFKREDG